MRRSFISYLLLIFFMAGCSSKPKLEEHPSLLTRIQIIFGTDVKVSLEPKYETHFEEVFAQFRKVDHLLSNYRSESELSRLNQKKRLKVSPWTKEFLELSLKAKTETQGYFEPTIGALSLDLYGFQFDHERLPSPDEIETAQVGLSFSISNQGEVELPPGVKIDSGGMGKGYALDKAAEYLESQGIQKAVLAASGDIRCLSSCEIQIQHPTLKEKKLFQFKTPGPNWAVSTSGTYERFIQTPKNHHLLNPKTGRPQSLFISVSLFGPAQQKFPSSTLDALATAVASMPLKMALDVLRKKNLEFILVTTDKKIHTSYLKSNLQEFSWGDTADFIIIKQQ